MGKFLGLLIGVFSVISIGAYACTGITVKTEKNEIIMARTVEYGEGNLHSKLIVSPRGKEYQSLTPDGKNNGLKWKGKYGFVGISLLNDLFIGEGINEAGLNAGLFYFPHYGNLKRFDPKLAKKTLVDLQFVSWMLSNFKNVDEVKEGLKKIIVTNIQYLDDGTPLPTAHWRVADKNGGNIVIEIVNNGEVKIYENKVGILTNSPDYDWQIKNLNNYINLYAGNAENYEKNGQKIFSFGAGTGMLGLPGDITPPSRFVRAFFMLNTLKTPTNAYEGVIDSFHILNNFDIPIGLEYSKEHQKYIPEGIRSATQWTAASNLSDGEFYYKTMYNGQIRKVDLSKIDFSKVGFKSLPLDPDMKENIKEVEI